MTLERLAVLTCDDCGLVSEPAPGVLVLREAGWSRRGGRDVCPSCARRRRLRLVKAS